MHVSRWIVIRAFVERTLENILIFGVLAGIGLLLGVIVELVIRR